MQSCGRGGAMPSKKPAPATPAKAVLRKGAWTHEEDLLLRRCIEKYGEGKWRQVPQRAGLQRCRKSCRLRWLNYLRPNLKRGDFAEDEIDLILRLHKLLGNKWSLIAGRIPGRTANDIKNYWNAHLRKTLAARCSALAKAAQGSGGGANGGAGKTSLEKRAHATTKSYDRDMTNTLDVLPPSTTTPTKATTTSRSKATTFTVIKPQPRTLTASIRFATTPSSEPVGMASSTDHCTPAPLQIITDFSHILVPEGSVSPIPPSPEDQIAMWWDGVLDGLVPSGDGLLWGSCSEGHPPVGAIFEDQVFWGNQEEDEQQQQPDYVSHQPVIGN